MSQDRDSALSKQIDARKIGMITNVEKLELVSRSLEQKLDQNKMEGFSLQAAAALSETQVSYVRELAERSIDLAKGDGLEIVSEYHVKRASRDLRRADVSTLKTAFTIGGGALLGTAVQEIVDIFNASGALDKQEVLLTMLILVLGVVAVMVGLKPTRRD